MLLLFHETTEEEKKEEEAMCCATAAKEISMEATFVERGSFCNNTNTVEVHRHI